MTVTAKWTFMVYLAGDNNLSDAGLKDLNEMRAVGSTPAVNIVAEYDNHGKEGTHRYYIQPHGIGEDVVSLSETDCGDPMVLLDFIAWAVDKYPAERYALVLWNHGGGWEPSEMDKLAQSVNAIDWNEREGNERSSSSLNRVFFRPTLEKIFSLSTVAERAICQDDGSGHSLDTIELGNVLQKTKALLGQPLDLLGMDACLMSNLEVAYQARPYVQYIVASEENEPNDGWPYNAVLHEFVANPELPTSDLATRIVQAYVASYVQRGYTGAVTQSALNLFNISHLIKPLNKLSEALIAHIHAHSPGAKYELEEALYLTSAKFHHSTLWDVANFCDKLTSTTSDDLVKKTGQEVFKSLQPHSNCFVIAESHNGPKVKACGGTTIYLPPRVLYGISQYYKDTAYARDHHWSPMLTAYHS